MNYLLLRCFILSNFFIWTWWYLISSFQIFLIIIIFFVIDRRMGFTLKWIGVSKFYSLLRAWFIFRFILNFLFIYTVLKLILNYIKRWTFLIGSIMKLSFIRDFSPLFSNCIFHLLLHHWTYQAVIRISRFF